MAFDRIHLDMNFLTDKPLEGYQLIQRNYITILKNGMIYINDLGFICKYPISYILPYCYKPIVHEMKGVLFWYKISGDPSPNLDNNISTPYKCIEWYSSNNYVQFIISNNNSKSVHLFSPMKEFAFGTANQLMADTPQFRMQDPDGDRIRRLTYYRSLKSEEFLILGYYKETEKFKEVVIPAPVVEKEKFESPPVKTMPYMLKKEGFDDLKPILPMQDIEVPINASQDQNLTPQPLPIQTPLPIPTPSLTTDNSHIVSNLPRVNKIPGLGLRPPNLPSTTPIIHRPTIPASIEHRLEKSSHDTHESSPTPAPVPVIIAERK